MDETVALALKHQRELHDALKKDVEQLDSKFAVYRKESREARQAEIASTHKWDRGRAVGFVLVGLLLSSIPEYVPFLKALLSP